MFFVLIETNGNQDYVFQTNKIRENVGASQIINDIGTTFVKDAIEYTYPTSKDAIASDLAEPPSACLSNQPFTTVIVSSGKALLLVDNRANGRAIISNVTLRAAVEAPGIDVCGVVSEEVDLTQPPTAPNSAAKRLNNLYRAVERERSEISASAHRHCTFPFIEQCASSGLPAFALDQEDRPQPLSRIGRSKRTKAVRDRWRCRMERLETGDIPSNLEELFKIYEEELPWIAIVHADGNGIGQVFHSLGKRYDTGHLLIDALWRFSIELDNVAVLALRSACKKLWYSKDPAIPSDDGSRLPAIPLIVGGDDLTVLLPGQVAIEFAVDYLSSFEAISKENEVVRDVCQRDRLTASAGISITRTRFPSHTSYELAEQLIRSAKDLGKISTEADKPIHRSALDFHVLFDSTFVDLETIRGRQRPVSEIDTDTDSRNRHFLTAKPYLVSEKNSAHYIDKLRDRVRIMQHKDTAENEASAISHSMLHRMKEAYFESPGAAAFEARRLSQMSSRFAELLEYGNRPFIDEPDEFHTDDKRKQHAVEAPTILRTHFVDALELLDFWPHSSDDVKTVESEQTGNA